jgi:tetratricopeptide (TPR) repeat protein
MERNATHTAQAALALAQSKERADDLEGALEQYTLASELDPMSVTAFSGQAVALLRLKQPQRSIAALDQALRILPSSSYLLVLRAFARYACRCTCT